MFKPQNIQKKEINQMTTDVAIVSLFSLKKSCSFFAGRITKVTTSTRQV